MALTFILAFPIAYGIARLMTRRAEKPPVRFEQDQA
jgi:ABC-type spermidine/putrescine transport system permease subunit I